VGEPKESNNNNSLERVVDLRTVTPSVSNLLLSPGVVEIQSQEAHEISHCMSDHSQSSGDVIFTILVFTFVDLEQPQRLNEKLGTQESKEELFTGGTTANLSATIVAK